MCFTANKDSYDHQIAQEDIIVDKYFYFEDEYIESPYLAYRYNTVLQKEVSLLPAVGGSDNFSSKQISIEQGYHSFAQGAKVPYQRSVIVNGSRIVGIECIIPKGAEFYKNDTNEYVSSTIQLTGNVFHMGMFVEPYLLSVALKVLNLEFNLIQR